MKKYEFTGTNELTKKHLLFTVIVVLHSGRMVTDFIVQTIRTVKK